MISGQCSKLAQCGRRAGRKARLLNAPSIWSALFEATDYERSILWVDGFNEAVRKIVSRVRVLQKARVKLVVAQELEFLIGRMFG